MIEKMGRIFSTNGNDVYRLTHYQEQPTLTLKNLDTGEQITETLMDVRKKFVELVPAFQNPPNAENVQRPDSSDQWQKKNIMGSTSAAQTTGEWLKSINNDIPNKIR